MSADEDSPRPTFWERFPALRRLTRLQPSKRIPFIAPLTQRDCGPACLSMVLGLYGKDIRVEELRSKTSLNPDGTSLYDLLEAGRAMGLRGRGVAVDPSEVEYLDQGAILHWEGNHFVVFDRRDEDGVEILDPAMGRRKVRHELFNKSFVGVALLLEPGESFVEGKVERGDSPTWAAARPLLAESRWGRTLVLSLVLQALALVVPLLTGIVVDRVLPRGDYHLLAVLGVGLVIVVGAEAVAQLVRANLLIEFRVRFDTLMAFRIMDHLIELPFRFFQQRQTGDILMRLGSVAQIREQLASTAMTTLLDGGLAIIYFALLFSVNAAMAGVTVVLALFFLGTYIVTRRRMSDLYGEEIQTSSRVSSHQFEMLSSIEELKATGDEPRSAERWSDLYVDATNVSIAKSGFSAMLDGVKATLTGVAPLIILGFGALQVMNGALSLGTMLAIWALAGSLLAPISGLADVATNLLGLKQTMARIDEILRTPPEQPFGREYRRVSLGGTIELDDVSFRYDANSPLVLKNVSLRIEPGQMVAIVGRSGSGKSTLAALLLGLYAPESGRVRFGDADLKDIDLRHLRRQAGVVMQRSHLFAGTVRENIARSDPSLSLDVIEEASRIACIHEDISALAHGYQTWLPEGGGRLSGGQRQRLAIARALARRPTVLILDEATNSLDAATEFDVYSQLSKLKSTRVVIAHRLSTIRNADLIVMMHEGRIVEQGTHAELLKQNGPYAKLVSMQVATPTGA